MKDFQKLYEAVNTTLRQTKILRYPKQIQFSEEFHKALTKEVARHMQILDESKEPIRDLPEKFLKALKFELTELTEKKTELPNQLKAKPRQQWAIKPTERVHQAGKKPGYDRNTAKREWKKAD
jgi:hypothetical protein